MSKFDIVKFRHSRERLAKFDKVEEKKLWFTLGNYFPFVSFPSNRWTMIMALKKKNPVYKNQGWEPIHQKYKANESMNEHNPKNK